MTAHDKYLKDKQYIMAHRVKMVAYNASMALRYGFIQYAWDRRFNSHKRLQLI